MDGGGGGGGMDVAMALEALGLDASDAHPSEDEIRAAFKAQALIWHPDKNARQEEATVRFQQLSEALELLLAVGQAPAAAAGGAGEGPTAASLGLRAMAGPQIPADSLTGEDEISVVWRCGACPEPETICCRLNPAKASCLCGHKLSRHRPGKRGLRCMEKGCDCASFEYHVQQGGWAARCGCKHKHTDHESAAPHKCTKPGCRCAAFHVRWVCSCGHGWEDHSTCFVRAPYRAGTREWVCGALRPEAAAEAKEKRARWAAKGRAPPSASAAAHRQAAGATAPGHAPPKRRALQDGAGSTPEPEAEPELEPDLVRTSAEADALRQQVRGVYAQLVPAKSAEEVEGILARFAGKEAELLAKVQKKYQPSC